MARYRGPDCRICRREGEKLFLKGEKCLTNRCILIKRGNPPGQLVLRRGNPTSYGVRLRAKQKLKRVYGVLEAQLVRFFNLAGKQRTTPRGEKLIELLESRLDNVVYRMNFASSRDTARQMVTHGHVIVNGKKVYSPSFLVRRGDTIGLNVDFAKTPQVLQYLELTKNKSLPVWLEKNPDGISGRVVDYPKRSLIELPVDEKLVVEFYSR